MSNQLILERHKFYKTKTGLDKPMKFKPKQVVFYKPHGCQVIVKQVKPSRFYPYMLQDISTGVTILSREGNMVSLDEVEEIAEEKKVIERLNSEDFVVIETLLNKELIRTEGTTVQMEMQDRAKYVELLEKVRRM